ncbi:MAG: hypothetical protein AAGC74_05095 [Verrucomicrobiota bacterium]
MPKNIGFRVTGMYLGGSPGSQSEIRLDIEKDNPTVYDVMVEVSKKINGGDYGQKIKSFGFSPTFPTEFDSLNSITAEYGEDPFGGKYREGIYRLEESKSSNPVNVLQYYIFDEEFRQKNNNNRTRNFNQTPDVEIKDNYTIVWRQLSILTGPNGNNRIASELVNFSKSIAALSAAGMV